MPRSFDIIETMKTRSHALARPLAATAPLRLAATASLRLLVALTQAPDEGLSLRELARSVGVADSTALHALRTLIASELAAVDRRRGRPRYRPSESEPARHARAFALEVLPRDELLAIVARASPAVELAALDDGGLIVVKSDLARPRDETRLDDVLRVAGRGVRVVSQYHDDVVRTLREDPALRVRALRASVLKGTLERSLPDRARRRRQLGRRLGRPHPLLRVPSRRTLQRLARRFGLRRIGLFGSAVRSDFRPDSDVDVLVEFRPGARPGLLSMVELQHALELFFGRDVDVVTESSLRPWVRSNASRELVPLHGG